MIHINEQVNQESICFKYNNDESFFVHNLNEYVSIAPNMLEKLYALAQNNISQKSVASSFSSALSLPVFKSFPLLSSTLPHVSLSNMPTPVQNMKKLGNLLGHKNLYIKRDDLIGKILKNGESLFGGNKIRKLEFLLGDALMRGATSIMTVGPVGSNHVVATAACANYLGLKSISLLNEMQPNTRVVKRNLALMDYYKTEVHFCPDAQLYSMAAAYLFYAHKVRHGNFPYVIPMGGGCAVGALGFVNAAFELKEQIKCGQMPEPDRLYVPASSMGTITGLLLGCRLAGLKTKIIGVIVEPEEFPGKSKELIISLFNKTNELLHQADPSIALLDVDEDDFEILVDFYGTGYGLITQEAAESIRLIKETENITLDGTYAGKTMAGLIHDIMHHADKNEVILFWNTFYGEDCSKILTNFDYTKLPKAVHLFFESPVQSLEDLK